MTPTAPAASLFNLPPGNTRLSTSHDVRHACVKQLSTLQASQPTRPNNTLRPWLMSVARCDCDLWPRASVEAISRSCAWLVQMADEHQSAELQGLTLPESQRAFDPPSPQAGSRPTARSAPPRWLVAGPSVDWYPARSSLGQVWADLIRMAALSMISGRSGKLAGRGGKDQPAISSRTARALPTVMKYLARGIADSSRDLSNRSQPMAATLDHTHAAGKSIRGAAPPHRAFTEEDDF
jgi:hypothetical protein